MTDDRQMENALKKGMHRCINHLHSHHAGASPAFAAYNWPTRLVPDLCSFHPPQSSRQCKSPDTTNNLQAHARRSLNRDQSRVPAGAIQWGRGNQLGVGSSHCPPLLNVLTSSEAARTIGVEQVYTSFKILTSQGSSSRDSMQRDPVGPYSEQLLII